MAEQYSILHVAVFSNVAYCIAYHAVPTWSATVTMCEPKPCLTIDTLRGPWDAQPTCATCQNIKEPALTSFSHTLRSSARLPLRRVGQANTLTDRQPP